MKINIVISSKFFESYIDLPKPTQIKVVDFFEKFIENPHAKGINLEKIGTREGKKLYSVRIDKTYRGIVYVDDKNNTYHILWIEHHDEAYERAVRVLKIILSPNQYKIGLGPYPQKIKKLFEDIDDEELLLLGVPSKYIDLIRNIPDIQAFKKIQSLQELGDDVYEKLEFIAFGIYLEEVKEHERLVREELLEFIKKQVILPALEHEDLDPDIKKSVKNTLQRLEKKETVKEIMNFFDDARDSKRGEEIVAEFRKHGLKAFEDIVEEVKKIGAR